MIVSCESLSCLISILSKNRESGLTGPNFITLYIKDFYSKYGTHFCFNICIFTNFVWLLGFFVFTFLNSAFKWVGKYFKNYQAINLIPLNQV